MPSLKADMAEVKTHVLYLREHFDSLWRTKATKLEVKIHRWAIGGLFTGMLMLAGWVFELKR
jgi:hypothetical protein